MTKMLFVGGPWHGREVEVGDRSDTVKVVEYGDDHTADRERTYTGRMWVYRTRAETLTARIMLLAPLHPDNPATTALLQEAMSIAWMRERTPAGTLPQEACRSCGAAVVWTLTRLGKRMPLDYAPTPAGDQAVVVEGGGNVRSSYVPVADRSGRDDLRTSHFVTCPHAGQWRGKG